MSLRHLLLVVAIGAALAGCSSDNGYFEPAASQDAAKLSPQAAKTVAVDMAGKLADRLDPRSGPIMLAGDGSPIGAAFEEALRGHGYRIHSSADQAPEIRVAYTIANVNGAIMVRLSTPTIELSRTYVISGTGASPASPLSVLQYVKEG